MLYIPVNIFSHVGDNFLSSWVEPVQWIKCLAQGHSNVTPLAVSVELAARHSKSNPLPTEPLCSYTGKPYTSAFTNSEDPDEMPQNVAFNQDLHCLLG